MNSALGTLAYALGKTSSHPPLRFVCLSYNVTRALRYFIVFCRAAKKRYNFLFSYHPSFITHQVRFFLNRKNSYSSAI